MAYNDNLKRTTEEEERAIEREKDCESRFNDLRRAAEVHRQVRGYARRTIKPGMSMTSIANLIEDGTRSLVEANGMQSGIGFPTGLSLDHCAAHYSPNPKDTIVLEHGNVMKVDFGVHVNGHIVDSAFTMTFDPVYDDLLKAVQEATETGVKAAGIDVVLADIGEQIQETMESFEVTIKGKTFPVKSIRNLNGHNINPYSIHGGKSVPIIKPREDNMEYQMRMEEGETFAIETFGSTGAGYVQNVGNCSHYALIPADKTSQQYRQQYNSVAKFSAAKHLLHVIETSFGTLPFCRRYLDRLGEESHLLGLSRLVKAGIVNDYPPLDDIDGCYTAQFEHTILLKPTAKEVVSRGEDY
ncbi:peptidase M24, structural domain-containing protein [Protomyces lactucae-debilis]|uniref:Methionine aminopeptidase 2 n=1 Tax=Protomyces lactucae-debilis TaxID=2754530 RepID=A0A1Y2FIG6_PROLT|nr:peptidase M24, structural domain-containing protein [Protomyces lactucae-debilis]ORY83036.1 peptidase M24, structural domain-containing protein [Protomyces lactucae-debilis]